VIKLRVTTVVNRPLEVVFAYLADFMNLPEYEPWVEKVEATSAGPIGVGSTWHHVRRQGRRRLERRSRSLSGNRTAGWRFAAEQAPSAFSQLKILNRTGTRHA
jgi:uncharacterized membrane protein